ncbi:MAG: MMPL family transporter [Planctomycetota bacterium]|nr:MMPL family transporter [Planctomycetota bacterium]
MTRLIEGVVRAPARRPVATLMIAGFITLLAVLGALRIHADASLSAMFPRNDPAARVMVNVLDRFRSADELLVLVTLPGNDDPPDPQRLLAFAGRFEAAVRNSPLATSLSEGLLYRGEPDAMGFIQNELGPAGIFYLDDQSLAAARQRLTPAGMRQRLAYDASMLSQPGPAAGALGKAMMQDPLGLHDFLLPKLQGAQPFPTYQNSDALIAPDGRALLIRVLGKKSLMDFDYAKALCDSIGACASRAEPRGLGVALSGGYAIAASSAASIRHDAITSIIGSILLLLALFVAMYRRPLRAFHLAFAPVAIGTLWGFGAYGWIQGGLSPIAAVIGGVLAGMGIDYSVLFLTRFETMRSAGADPRSAAESALSEIWPALVAAWITSVAGFVAIGWSSVKALGDFSILGTMGLTGSFLAAATVLPALATLFAGPGGASRGSAFRFGMEGYLRWVQKHRAGVIYGMSAVGIVALAITFLPRAPLLQPEADLSVMHPQPNAALDAEREITRRFGRGAETMLVYLKAPDSEQLVTLAHQVQSRLASPDIVKAGVVGTYGLATWLPDPAIVARRISQMQPAEADRVVADFKDAVAQSEFNPSAFEGYTRFLRELLTRRDAPDVAALMKYPGLARSLLPRDQSAPSTESVSILFLDHPTEDRAARDAAIDAVGAALRDLPGATLSGLAVVSHDAEWAVWTELPRLLLAAAILVAGYLLIHFRNLRDMTLSLLPAAFGLITLAALVRLVGVKLNMFNLTAMPLLIGIDVDYGIYLVTLARRGKGGEGNPIASGAHAVLVCATSMVAGYASLALTSIPAMRSLGLVVAVGVLNCMAGALLLLCAMLMGKRSSTVSHRSPGN